MRAEVPDEQEMPLFYIPSGKKYRKDWSFIAVHKPFAFILNISKKWSYDINISV